MRFSRLLTLLRNPYIRGALRLFFFFITASLALLEAIPGPDLLGTTPFSPAYTDRQNQLLRLGLASDDRFRIFVPLEKISPVMVEMTLVHEDRHFLQHFGVNPVALSKATWYAASGLGPHIGASTITMQLVRLHYGLNTKTIPGKIAQILVALHMEIHCSKREILQAYLNLAPYGRNIEGVGAASRIYFHTSPADLTADQAITLAVIPQSPARRAPGHHSPSHPVNEALNRARQVLLSQWMIMHPEDERLPGIVAMPITIHPTADLPFRVPHLIDQLIQETDRPAEETRLAIDRPTQNLVERVLHTFIQQKAEKGVKNACVLLVDYHTMEVRAAVGSANYKDKAIQGQVNGLHMLRSPGSALKPFIYALALDQGLIHPNSLLKDEPVSFNGYDPENFDRGFMGPISATKALVESRNVPAVELESRLAPGKNLYALLRTTGLPGLGPEKHYGLTIALGSAEISPVHVAQLYASLANGGLYQPLRYTADPPPASAFVASQPIRLFSPEASYLILDMLSTAHRPGATDASGMITHDGPVAWKTGTSFSFRDAWTAAIFDHYVMVVWVGNFDGTPNPMFVGRASAAPLAFSIIDALRATKPITDPQSTCFTPAPTLKIRKVRLCADSGALATNACIHTTMGWFIPGVSPITPCDVHRRVWIDNKTGKRWPNFPPDTTSAHQVVEEFWPSDLSRLFTLAGISHAPPAPLIESYASQQSHATASAHGPRILKPSAGLTYHIRLSDPDAEVINLQASAESSSETIHWFVDAACVGISAGSTPLAWSPHSGTHTIRAVDDKGRADSRTVTVTMVK